MFLCSSAHRSRFHLLPRQWAAVLVPGKHQTLVKSNGFGTGWHLGPASFYLTFLRLLLIMLLDRFKEFFRLFSNKKPRIVRWFQFAFIASMKRTVYITFMFALSPSSLARLCKSAYFMESKSIFDAFRSDFIGVRAHSRRFAVRKSRPTVEILGIQTRAAGAVSLAVICYRKCLPSNQNEDGSEPLLPMFPKTE